MPIKSALASSFRKEMERIFDFTTFGAELVCFEEGRVSQGKLQAVELQAGMRE